jgi:hypothetical protein
VVSVGVSVADIVKLGVSVADIVKLGVSVVDIVRVGVLVGVNVGVGVGVGVHTHPSYFFMSSPFGRSHFLPSQSTQIALGGCTLSQSIKSSEDSVESQLHFIFHL